MSSPSTGAQSRGAQGTCLSSRARRLSSRAALLALACISVEGCDGLTAAQAARDPELQRAGISLYPARNVGKDPAAVIFFFGNDVGFWGPHRKLAAALRYRGVSVAGLDITPILARLPEPDSLRPQAWLDVVLPLIDRTRQELGAGRVPLILAGHSLGAELALWTASCGLPTGVTGVMLLSPGTRSHLRATMTDRIMSSDPEGSGTFSIDEALRALPANQTVSIVRGSRDDYASADSALRVTGGERARLFNVPFSGHSLLFLTFSLPVVSRAVDWIVERPTAAQGSLHIDATTRTGLNGAHNAPNLATPLTNADVARLCFRRH